MDTNVKLGAAVAGGLAVSLIVAPAVSAEPLRDVVEPLCSSLEADFEGGTPRLRRTAAPRWPAVATTFLKSR